MRRRAIFRIMPGVALVQRLLFLPQLPYTLSCHLNQCNDGHRRLYLSASNAQSLTQRLHAISLVPTWRITCVTQAICMRYHQRAKVCLHLIESQREVHDNTHFLVRQS